VKTFQRQKRLLRLGAQSLARQLEGKRSSMLTKIQELRADSVHQLSVAD
jgi:hypothetical protein